MPDRRAELLDRVANYILSNGLADLSLRPLATAIGTSPRMLLYFFGSKERLIAEALAHIRIREQIDFKRAVSKPRPADRLESLLRDGDRPPPLAEKYSRLFFEVYGLALQNPEKFPEFLERAVGDWLPLFEQAFTTAGVSPVHAQTLATLALGAVRGLHLDCSLPANESVPRQLFGKCYDCSPWRCNRARSTPKIGPPGQLPHRQEARRGIHHEQAKRAPPVPRGGSEQRTTRHLVGLHAAGRVRRDTGHLPLIAARRLCRRPLAYVARRRAGARREFRGGQWSCGCERLVQTKLVAQQHQPDAHSGARIIEHLVEKLLKSCFIDRHRVPLHSFPSCVHDPNQVLLQPRKPAVAVREVREAQLLDHLMASSGRLA